MVRKMCVYKINTVCRYEIQPTFIIFKCHFLFSSHMLLNKKKRREQEKPPKCNRDFPKGRYYLTALQLYPSVDNFSLSEWAKYFENRIYQERRRQKKYETFMVVRKNEWNPRNWFFTAIPHLRKKIISMTQCAHMEGITHFLHHPQV